MPFTAAMTGFHLLVFGILAKMHANLVDPVFKDARMDWLASFFRVERGALYGGTLLAISAILGGGVLWSAAGLGMPRAATVFLDMLGACAGPCALFAVGLFLAGQDSKALLDRARIGEVCAVSVVKLVVQPVATWFAGAWLGLEPFLLASAVLGAAFPVGATAFVLAQRHRVYVERCSATILLSTVLSIATLALAMVVLDPRP